MTKPDTITDEIWRSIPGWEGIYEASSLGRVRRVLQRPGTYAPRVLPGCTTRRGYRCVGLCHDGFQQRKFVHQLVAHAFLGPQPDGYEINHINADKADNRAANLEYVTHKENQEHASRLKLFRHGDDHWMRRFPEKLPRGENRPCAKLSPEKVRTIRAMLASGISCYRVARIYNVASQTIEKIKHGKIWNHV